MNFLLLILKIFKGVEILFWGHLPNQKFFGGEIVNIINK
jgi:hypothetical protein